MDKQEISLIIPAYNEEQRIGTVLTRLCRDLPDQEIIVVCNGCSDATFEIVKQMSAAYPQIKSLTLPEKPGKGRAIIYGLKQANNNKLGFADSDESVEPDDLIKMFASLSSADCVIASRRLGQSEILVQQPLVRRIASKSFNILVRRMFGLNIKDTQCGAKVFRRDAVKSILGEMTCSGFEFDVELLWRLKNKGFQIKEFPIVWKHSPGSHFTLRKAPGMFISLLRLRYGRNRIPDNV